MNMKKMLIAAATLAIVALLASPVWAVCGVARLIQTADVQTPGVCPGAFCYGPYYTSVTSNLKGAWWALGAGDPNLLAGNDNGSFPAIANPTASNAGFPTFMYNYGQWVTGYLYYPVTVNTTWAADGGIDNCVDGVAGTKCTAILLSDTFGGQGYFALATDEAGAATGNYDFRGLGTINLVQIPKAGIDGSNRVSNTQVDLTVAGIGDISGGLYLDPACDALGPISGYRVYSQNIAGHGGAPPASRDISQWTALSAPQANLNMPTVVSATCSGEADIYLSYSVAFDSGYEIVFVGDNSTRVECGEFLADPGDRPGQIQLNNDRVRPGRSSGRKGGGR